MSRTSRNLLTVLLLFLLGFVAYYTIKALFFSNSDPNPSASSKNLARQNNNNIPQYLQLDVVQNDVQVPLKRYFGSSYPRYVAENINDNCGGNSYGNCLNQCNTPQYQLSNACGY
jgi:hypothetical protein